MLAFIVESMVTRGPLTPVQQFSILSRIWGGEDTEPGYVFLPWIKGSSKTKEERRRNWNEGRAFEWPMEKAAILAHLTERNDDELYFSVNKFLEPSRIAQRVAESITLYADLDEVHPKNDIDRAIQPTIAWESSPGRFQGVWVMRGMYFGACDMGGLNHRLTAMLGADPSGWDVTQVLRVPGRKNHKPEYKEENGGEPVQGRLLWVRSQTFDWAEMEERLPTVQTYGLESELEDHEIDSVDRHAVWARVRLKVSHTVRKYMGMKSRQIDPDQYDRSEVLWQIERDLADAGCTIAEIVAVVRPTPWNKYEGRSNELAQLKSEAIKAKSVTLQDQDEETLESEDLDGNKPPTPLWFTDVLLGRVERPAWLVRNIWAKGSVGFIAGQPKSYKSYIALDMALSVATGTPFLNDQQFSTVPGKVLYLQEEDSLPIVLHRAEQILEQKAPQFAPKGQIMLEAGDVGGRRARASQTISELVWVPPVASMPLALHVRTGFMVSSWEWQSWLDSFIAEHEFNLVVVDTLGTTAGDIDTDKASPLNDRVLKPLKTIAENNGCAIAIVHHNRKPNDNGKTRAGQQMLGSVALHAWVESALYVQSKETVSDGLYEVKLERENKLVEDMRFRIRIPQMWIERLGHEGNRQLWEPEIHPGWGDKEPEQKAIYSTKKYQGAGGAKLAAAMALHGKGGQALMLAEIARIAAKTENQCMREIQRGIADGNWEETEDGAFIALTL